MNVSEMNSMERDGFEKGICRYRAESLLTIPQPCLQPEGWHNGYYAFSHKEVAKHGFDPAITHGIDLFGERVCLDGTSSYLMEIGLWRQRSLSSGHIAFEEISLEREPDGFFLQQWILYPYEEHRTLQPFMTEGFPTNAPDENMKSPGDGQPKKQGDCGDNLQHDESSCISEASPDRFKETPDTFRCWYRKAETRSNHIRLFDDTELRTMEIVIPTMRLHFYLTTGEV